MKSLLVAIACALSIGGSVNAEGWVPVRDKESGIEVQFPCPPVEMSFELPFQNTPATGKVHLYSTEWNGHTFIFSICAGESISKDVLEPAVFQKKLQEVLISYLFFSPAVLQAPEAFASSVTHYQGYPALAFDYAYYDKDLPWRLKGLGFVKEHQLYNLLIIAPEKDFEPEISDRFIHSLTEV